MEYNFKLILMGGGRPNHQKKPHNSNMLIFLSLSHLPLCERQREGKNDSVGSVPGRKVGVEGQTADMFLKADAFWPLLAPHGKIISRKKTQTYIDCELVVACSKKYPGGCSSQGLWLIVGAAPKRP